MPRLATVSWCCAGTRDAGDQGEVQPRRPRNRLLELLWARRAEIPQWRDQDLEREHRARNGSHCLGGPRVGSMGIPRHVLQPRRQVDRRVIAATMSIQAWDAATGETAWTLARAQGCGFRHRLQCGWLHAGFRRPRSDRKTVGHAEPARKFETLRGHSADIYSVAFSPDQERLVSVSGGQYRSGSDLPSEVKLWDTATGQEILSSAGGGGLRQRCRVQPRGPGDRLGQRRWHRDGLGR